MAADFPENVVNLPNKSDGEKLYAAEYNKIVDEITAIETELKKSAADTIVEAADSAKLGGIAPSGYLGASAQAADSAKLGGVAASEFLQIPSWQDWTPTLTGWSATTLLRARYCQVGKMVFGAIMIVGTSNATTAVATLPITASSTGGMQWRGTWGFAYDNGGVLASAGAWYINSGGTDITFFKTMADGAAWTAENSKRVYTTFFYEAA